MCADEGESIDVAQALCQLGNICAGSLVIPSQATSVAWRARSHPIAARRGYSPPLDGLALASSVSSEPDSPLGTCM